MPSPSHRRAILFLAAALTLTGCKPPDQPTPAPEPTPKPAIMSAADRTTAATLAQSHPTYKLFRQKIDMPTILVVAETTTDDQLKSLLWHLRTKIRGTALEKDIALQPSATLYGIPGYPSGVVDIYRGAKCAEEQYITSGPDPCGSSIHKSASYHWGDGGDPTADGASIIATTGAIIPVFDSTDHWQTEAEARSDPDGSKQLANADRIHYATSETAKQSKRGSDLKFFVATPSDEINAISYQFADGAGQRRFLNEYVFLEQEHLCAAGFRTIKLSAVPKPGHSYPLSCK